MIFKKKKKSIDSASPDYCAAFCTPNVSQSSYLETVGEKLLPGIDILWTGMVTVCLFHCFQRAGPSHSFFLNFLFCCCSSGPKVVSHKISVESIEEVTTVLKRAPVIWDNIHANDYDPQRFFLGPFKVYRNRISSAVFIRSFLNVTPLVFVQDRPSELIPKLRGVLTNPNCEFYLNFVAIHTLATWCKSSTAQGTRDVEMGELCFSSCIGCNWDVQGCT